MRRLLLIGAFVLLLAVTPQATGVLYEKKVIRKLNTGLRHTPMRGLGKMLVQEGKRGGLHPAFIAGAAGTESSFGSKACYRNRYNVWGLGACDRAWKVPYFSSWRKAIRYYVRFIRERWPGATRPWHFYGYCECGAGYWGSKTSAHMRSLGFGPVVALR